MWNSTRFLPISLAVYSNDASYPSILFNLKENLNSLLGIIKNPESPSIGIPDLDGIDLKIDIQIFSDMFLIAVYENQDKVGSCNNLMFFSNYEKNIRNSSYEIQTLHKKCYCDWRFHLGKNKIKSFHIIRIETY